MKKNLTKGRLKIISSFIFVFILMLIGMKYQNNIKLNTAKITSKTYLTEGQRKDFVDENFYKCIIDSYNQVYKTNLTIDDTLNDTQLSYIYLLSCRNYNITDTTGIEKLPILSQLDLANNNISSIDLTNNKALTYLDLSKNNINSINLSNNKELKYLYMNDNNIEDIDLSNNTAILNLSLSNNNINSLSLSNNKELEFLVLSSNKMKNINLTNNVNIKELNIDSNTLENITLPDSKTLEKLDLHNNKLNSIDVSNYSNLTKLTLSVNKLSTIDLSNNNNLKELYISSNNLTELDISNLNKLEYINAAFNKYEYVEIPNPAKIRGLTVETDWISKYNLSQFSNLEYLGLTDYITIPAYKNELKKSKLYKTKNKNISYKNYIVYDDNVNRNNENVVISNKIKNNEEGSKQYVVCATNVRGYNNYCGEEIPNNMYLKIDDNIVIEGLDSFTGKIYYTGYREVTYTNKNIGIVYITLAVIVLIVGYILINKSNKKNKFINKTKRK